MQSFQPGKSENISYNCPINLCSDYLTVAQLHPDFKTYVHGSICCPHDVGLNVYVVYYHGCIGPHLMIVMIFSSYAARKVENTNLVLVEVSGSCKILGGESVCSQILLPTALVVHNTRKKVLNSPMPCEFGMCIIQRPFLNVLKHTNIDK